MKHMLAVAELILVLIWIRLALLFVLGLMVARRRTVEKTTQLKGTQLAANLSVYGLSPRISVIVPALDEAATIEMSLKSLLAQEPLPQEIIVVDDGSTDATATVAKHTLAGFDGGRVIELGINLGKAEALNIGISAACGEFVATIDADTRLELGALKAALSYLDIKKADAVAFYVDVDNQPGLLPRLQRQEYVASLNLERAGQEIFGAISILPGAATLFRREALCELEFSGRTRTEDADLTLLLSRRGAQLVFAENAVAKTLVPATWGDLLAQRVRWTTGHLQCCAVHACERCGARMFFTAIVLPNFVLSTTIVAVAFFAMLPIAIAGRAPSLGLDWRAITLISIGLVLLQRGVSFAIGHERRPTLTEFVLEPFVSMLIGAVSFVGALYVLRPIALASKRINYQSRTTYESGRAAPADVSWTKRNILRRATTKREKR